MIEQISYHVTMICTVIGFIAMVAGLIWLAGWLVFQAVDMFLRVKGLRKAFIEFYFDKKRAC